MLKNAQMDAVSQIFVDFLPVLNCFNTINLNLYHYAGNSPVKYLDPDGRVNCSINSKYQMNTQTEGNYDYPEEILNDESAFIYNQGCAITIVANMLNTMGFNNCTPSDVNSEEFINEEGNVKWGAIADRTKYVLERKNLQFTFELYDAQENDLENKYYTAIKVQYCTDANSPHWVGVNGKRVKNGINYFIISPTSVNDSNVGNGTIRNGQGWINDSDGSILVPESKVTAYRIFKTQNEEFVK